MHRPGTQQRTRRRPSAVAAAAIAIVVAALGAGCSSDSKADETTTTAESTSSSETTTTTTSSTTTVAAKEPTPADPSKYTYANYDGQRADLAGGLGFRSPTGNIACEIHGDASDADVSPYVACQIEQHTWKVPEQPCELDWSGSVISLDREGVSKGRCAGDIAVTPGANELPYDESLTQGPITCTSRRTGVTCTYAGTNHRFHVSREVLETS